MESIIPQRRMVEQILEQLSTWIPDFDAESVLTSLAILDFAHQVMGTMDAHFGRYELSQGRFTVLMFLYHFPEAEWTPASLADAAGVRRATMTGLLQKLERDNWIARAPDATDGRRSLVDLTKSGKGRFKEILPDHFGRFAVALDEVSAGEHTKVRSTLAEFGKRVRSVVEEDPSTPSAAG